MPLSVKVKKCRFYNVITRRQIYYIGMKIIITALLAKLAKKNAQCPYYAATRRNKSRFWLAGILQSRNRIKMQHFLTFYPRKISAFVSYESGNNNYVLQ